MLFNLIASFFAALLRLRVTQTPKGRVIPWC
jgi:hypothetical protein